MRIRRQEGFTLIELLVVIAIIGILAAMVFPVFARARESARKAVCLSNVKNIALALQMYFADNNDTFPPGEHRPEVVDWYETRWNNPGCPLIPYNNPYLRWPVVLDEYVKNRDVWQCPSAKMTGGALCIVPGPDWFGYLVATDGMWGNWISDTGNYICPNDGAFPPGWGGEVTDSIAQERLANPGWRKGDTALRAFVQGIGMPETPDNYGLKMTQIEDAAWFVVAGDNGVFTVYQSAINWAYPDMCEMGCLCEKDHSWAFENCPWSADCKGTTEQRRDPQWRASKTRHLGGVNLGFADGHASWFNSQWILTESPKWPSKDAFENRWPNQSVVEGKLKGISMLWYPTTTPSGEDWSTECGAPPLY